MRFRTRRKEHEQISQNSFEDIMRSSKMRQIQEKIEEENRQKGFENSDISKYVDDGMRVWDDFETYFAKKYADEEELKIENPFDALLEKERERRSKKK